MNDQRQNLYRSSLVLKSLIVPVFVLSLIDILNLSFLIKFSFLLVLVITASLKIYLMSGLGGCLIEIISGQEYVLQLRRIHQNAMELWPGFLVVVAMIRVADFILFASFPEWRIWRTAYFSLLEVMGAFMLARWVIDRKYIAPLGLPRRKFRFKASSLMVLILAVLSELILGKVLNFISAGGFHWRNISAFAVNYIHVFEFIFCSLCILEDYPQISEKFNSPKEIFLINFMVAEVLQSLSYWFVRLYPPVFVVLKALTPKTYKFREFNQIMWHERYYKSKVLVCITCFTSNSYEAYKVAKEFKKRGAKVIMGGPHVTYFPEEALAFCDSVVIGQAEGVWEQVLHDYENGELQARYKGPATEVQYARVQEELLSSPPYVIKDFLETSRGCKFRCHFCTIPALSDGQVRTKSVGDIIELIKKIRPYYTNIKFIDNNIYSDPGYAKELFVALKPLKVKWWSQCTIDIAKNQETLRLARESGCAALAIGYEVSGASFEKNQGGKFAMAQKYFEYTRLIKQAGIKIKGQYIFGFDSDRFKDLLGFWKFCLSTMPLFTIVSILTPLPGSGVYRDMLGQNRIINLNWRSYSCHTLVVSHPRMDFKLVTFLFPFIQIFFLLTTCSNGLICFLAFFIYLGSLYLINLHNMVAMIVAIVSLSLFSVLWTVYFLRSLEN